MLPRDFTPAFNDAVNAKDWKLVIVMGEQAVAEHAASNDILYNLGLAYLKSNNVPMANGVFLAIPKNERDSRTNGALNESLRLSNASSEDLLLGSHGFRGGFVTLAEAIPTGAMAAITATGLWLLIVLFVIYISTQYKRMRNVFSALLVLSLIVIAIGATSLSIQYVYESHWGAIIADGSSSIYATPEEGAKVVRTMNSGKPVLVLGQAKGPWLRVLNADGDSGWVQSMDVRVIVD
jgi:hypothetical protein